MTITNGYCSETDFVTFTRITDLTDSSMVDTLINSASRMIDKYCGRTRSGFFLQSGLQTRDYHADSPWSVQVDDIASTAGLVVKSDINDDGTYGVTLTLDTDFRLYPLNSDQLSPARPWDELRIVNTLNVANGFAVDPFRPGVRVTAIFGWPAVPDEVKLATIYQAQMLYTAKDARGGIVQAGFDGGSTRLSRYLHPQAELLLSDFVKAPR